MTDQIDVLDHGYVRLVKTAGDELDIVNSARVSYDKESEYNPDGTLQAKDLGLIRFLLAHDHTAPFRHQSATYEIYAPLFVARQWFKYSVANTHIDDQNGWSESSRRYVTEQPVLHIPDFGCWRRAPANSKQGSGDPLPVGEGSMYTQLLADYVERGVELYNIAMQNDIAPEQARLFLPAYGLYVRWRWTTSLQGVLWFLQQRLNHDAQAEIQEYAQAVRDLTRPAWPTVIGTLDEQA